MKRALISPKESSETGQRIAQVIALGADFPVAPPLFWIDCADDVFPGTHFYDGANVQPVPVKAPPPPTQKELDRADAIAKANAAAISGSAADLKALAAALAKIL